LARERGGRISASQSKLAAEYVALHQLLATVYYCGHSLEKAASQMQKYCVAVFAFKGKLKQETTHG
jgi:hypothetical protein